MENSGQCISGKRLENSMNVIWHHAPSKQLISRAVELPQGIGNDLGHSVVSKKTRADATIKIFSNPADVQFRKPISFSLGNFPAHLRGGRRDILAGK